MPVFAYSGSNPTKAQVRGTIAADTPRQARELLREQGVQVHQLRESSQRPILSLWGQTVSRRLRQKWSLVAHELSMLLATGISLTDAIETLAAQHQGAFQASLLQLRDRVATGTGLATAMAEQPNIYDPISIRLVEVGENTGSLEQVLAELADLKMQAAEFRDRITTALMYPLFLAAMGVSAMIFLMTWVMPPLLESLTETLPQLPWPTSVAKRLSDLLVNFGWPIAVTVLVAACLAFYWGRTAAGRRMIQRALMRTPWVGSFLQKQAVARIALIVGLLLRSGMVLTSAIRLAAESTDNLIYRDALLAAEDKMTSGAGLSESLTASGVFPPLAVRFFAVGQDTGRLDEMLLRLASDYNRQVKVGAARLTAVLEPAMIIVMAIAIGFLLIATILPILEAGNIS